MAKRYDAQPDSDNVRNYARILGIVLLVVGVLGLLLGNMLFGLFNSDLLEDIIHLGSGGLMAYAGFALRDNGLARTLVGGLGVVYLLVGLLGFVAPNLFGLIPTGYTLADNLLHLALGILGIVVGFLLPRSAATVR
jgi:hypothetical protein